jgi:hypothetical protein
VNFGGRGAAALVDVRTGHVRIVPGSQVSSHFPALAWNSSGTRLYMATGLGRTRLLYYDVGSAGAVSTPVEPPAGFVSMVAA